MIYVVSCRTTVQGILNVAGALYSATLFLGISNCLTVQNVAAVQRAVAYRERAAGMYGVLPFTLAQVGSAFLPGTLVSNIDVVVDGFSIDILLCESSGSGGAAVCRYPDDHLFVHCVLDDLVRVLDSA